MKKNDIQILPHKYQQVAADIATKIVNGDYKVGDKIYARSSLASQYGVSSETARRAICVLSDLDIVKASKGSGVVISSYDNAVHFIRQYHDVQTISDLKRDIVSSVQRQALEMETFAECLKKLIDKTEHFRSVNPFTPFKIEITKKTPLIDRSISELKFWQNTTATIVAIRREDSLILSPGPYAVLCEKDILFFIGEDGCKERVHSFLYPEDN